MTALARTLLVGVVVPLLLALVAVTAILLVLPQLPDPVAVHWNGAGEPDGYAPVWIPLVIVGAVPIAFAAFVMLVGRPSADGFASTNQRALVATAPFLATVLSVTIGGSTVLQRGLASGADAPGIGGLLAAAFGCGLALAVGGWFVLPDAGEVGRSRPADPMPLSATESAVWTRRIGPSVPTMLVLAVAGAMVAAVAVLVWFVAPTPLAIGLTAVMLLLGLLVSGTLSWRVTVDANGLRVRSLLGVPDYRIPLADVASSSSIQVEPARDFGGWGIRWGGRRRWGVVTRSGPAIEVRRQDGREFVVTVPRADEAAALLAALATRDRSTR